MSTKLSTSVRGSVCSVAEGSNRTGSNFFPGSRILFPSLGSQEKEGMRPVIDLSILNKNVWVEFLDKRIVQVGMNLDRQCLQMS
jgi:hypothetical protein